MEVLNIKDCYKHIKSLKNFIEKNYPELYKYLLDKYQDSEKFSEKIYRYLYKLDEIPKCICGNPVKFINFKEGYHRFCSPKCSNNSVDSIEKRKNTCKQRYGVDNPAKSKLIQEKSKQTCKQRYGVDNAMKNKEIQEKSHNTCMKKYGCISPLGNKDIQEKSKQTCKQQYGVEYIGQSTKIQEKIRKICKEIYGAEYPVQSEQIKEKTKQICLKKYGVENVMQSKSIQNKIKEVFLERYGVDCPFKALEVQQKIYNTKKLNHTFNSSSIEEHFKNYLDSKNISYKTQYKSEKYPFCCDFYLDNLDLYIEIQGNWTHYKEPYNESNPSHQEILESWKSKSETHKYYKNAIQTWTIRDVHKRTTAKQNQLRYLEIFSYKIDEVIKVFEAFLKSAS